MKKLIAMLLAMAMLFSLAACGNQAEESQQGENATNTETPAPQNTDNVVVPENTSTPEDSQINNEVVEYYLGKANEVVVTDTHVIFTDDGSSEEISIAKNPQNVAVLYGSLACLWYEAGGTVQLAVGGKSASTLYKEQIGRDITQDAWQQPTYSVHRRRTAAEAGTYGSGCGLWKIQRTPANPFCSDQWNALDT